MKIDEPKTPYNGASDHEVSTDDEKYATSPRNITDPNNGVSPTKRWDELTQRLDAMSQQQQAGQDIRPRRVVRAVSSESSEDDEHPRTAEEEAKHREFLKHRKTHYDEGLKLKALLAKRKANGNGYDDDDDADDEDSDDDEQPPPGSK
jgi:hypothetical protein